MQVVLQIIKYSVKKKIKIKYSVFYTEKNIWYFLLYFIFPWFFSWDNYLVLLPLYSNKYYIFLSVRLPRTLGRHRFPLTIHEVSGNRTRDAGNYRLLYRVDHDCPPRCHKWYQTTVGESQQPWANRLFSKSIKGKVLNFLHEVCPSLIEKIRFPFFEKKLTWRDKSKFFVQSFSLLKLAILNFYF